MPSSGGVAALEDTVHDEARERARTSPGGPTLSSCRVVAARLSMVSKIARSTRVNAARASASGGVAMQYAILDSTARPPESRSDTRPRSKPCNRTRGIPSVADARDRTAGAARALREWASARSTKVVRRLSDDAVTLRARSGASTRCPAGSGRRVSAESNRSASRIRASLRRSQYWLHLDCLCCQATYTARE